MGRTEANGKALITTSGLLPVTSGILGCRRLKPEDFTVPLVLLIMAPCNIISFSRLSHCPGLSYGTTRQQRTKTLCCKAFPVKNIGGVRKTRPWGLLWDNLPTGTNFLFCFTIRQCNSFTEFIVPSFLSCCWSHVSSLVISSLCNLPVDVSLYGHSIECKCYQILEILVIIPAGYFGFKSFKAWISMLFIPLRILSKT